MKNTHKTIRNIIKIIGDNPDREGLKETPERVINAYKTLFSGYKQTAEEILKKSFTEHSNYSQIISLCDIDFFSTCEHHMLPFFGKCHVAYIPNDIVVGISKLARLVEMHSRRLQIQEIMTQDICNDIEKILKPKAVAVFVEAQHFCIKSRGIAKQNALMKTSAITGMFMNNEMARQELFSIIK